MVEFVGEWEARLQQARAGGCEYSTTVLALKLLGNFKTVLKLSMGYVLFLRKSTFLSRPEADGTCTGNTSLNYFLDHSVHSY